MRLPLLSHAEKSIHIYGLARNQLVRMEKSDKALHLYRKAYELGKDFPGYWYAMAGLYINAGDLEAAMESLDRIKTQKKHEDYKRFLTLSTLEKGKVYDLMGKRKSALKQYGLALKNDRTREEAEQYLKIPFSQR
jgi:tetratricopeptide (TPR) repeat protein